MRTTYTWILALAFLAGAGCGDDSDATGDGGSADSACFSPTQHTADAYEGERLGCACDPKHDQSVCVQAEGRRVALICDDEQRRWDAVEDGPCAVVDDAGVCEAKSAAFTSFVASHQTCERDEDCAVIGDCGPNADFTAVRGDFAEQAYELMKARCDTAWDGPMFDPVCNAGTCGLEEKTDECCGCVPDLDAGQDAGE